jgi:hypothetical protein
MNTPSSPSSLDSSMVVVSLPKSSSSPVVIEVASPPSPLSQASSSVVASSTREVYLLSGFNFRGSNTASMRITNGEAIQLFPRNPIPKEVNFNKIIKLATSVDSSIPEELKFDEGHSPANSWVIIPFEKSNAISNPQKDFSLGKILRCCRMIQKDGGHIASFFFDSAGCWKIENWFQYFSDKDTQTKNIHEKVPFTTIPVLFLMQESFSKISTIRRNENTTYPSFHLTYKDFKTKVDGKTVETPLLSTELNRILSQDKTHPRESILRECYELLQNNRTSFREDLDECLRLITSPRVDLGSFLGRIGLLLIIIEILKKEGDTVLIQRATEDTLNAVTAYVLNYTWNVVPCREAYNLPIWRDHLSVYFHQMCIDHRFLFHDIIPILLFRMQMESVTEERCRQMWIEAFEYQLLNRSFGEGSIAPIVHAMNVIHFQSCLRLLC